MRPMQQVTMAPTHQSLHPHAPHPHRNHQQMLSMAPHQQQMHHIHHPAMANSRMLMGMTPQNPNGTLINMGMKDQQNAIPLTIQNLQHQQHQHPPPQHQQPHLQQMQQQNAEQKKKDDTGESKNDELTNQQQQGQNNSANSNLTNSREKTPMCLVNELARFNKIQHQYRLTNEQGPAHKKRFTVTLMLGEEEYVSEGPSIKKAQHCAANDALAKTWYRKPPPKPTRTMKIYGKSPGGSGGHLPPTVELNALAMKRGEPTVYTFRHAPPAMTTPPQQFMPHAYGNFNHLRMFNPRYAAYNRGFHPEPQGMYLVSLKVGEREFIGRGMTGQAARHDAASRALEQLRQLPLPEETNNVNSTAQGEETSSKNAAIDDPNAELKSSVSLVHESALKRGLSVIFDVVSETGKPHIRTFMTKCTVGDIVTLGEGSSKKVSKKRAAELMLDELKRLPAIPAPVQNRAMRLKRKPPATKKKSRNLIKVYQEPRTESENSDEVNPISRLVQIQQCNREREPVYNLIEEKGAPRRREFVMGVSVGQYSAQGTGPNKKLAKKAAAEALLNILGYSKPQPQPVKPSIKTSTAGSNSAENKEKEQRKVTFVEVDNSNETTHSYPQGGSIGRQLVPGLLLVDNGSESKVVSGPSVQVVAEELRGQQQPQSSGISPKDQLTYLAQLLNFEVEFSDFPKGTYKEYLSLVSLSTDPPQVCHGHGPTKNASRDQAALTALRTLSKMGLDSVTNSGAKKDNKNGSTSGSSDTSGMHNFKQPMKSNNVVNGALDK